MVSNGSEITEGTCLPGSFMAEIHKQWPPPNYRESTVKVIDDRGNELLVVRKL